MVVGGQVPLTGGCVLEFCVHTREHSVGGPRRTAEISVWEYVGSSLPLTYSKPTFVN